MYVVAALLPLAIRVFTVSPRDCAPHKDNQPASLEREEFGFLHPRAAAGRPTAHANFAAPSASKYCATKIQTFIVHHLLEPSACERHGLAAVGGQLARTAAAVPLHIQSHTSLVMSEMEKWLWNSSQEGGASQGFFKCALQFALGPHLFR